MIYQLKNSPIDDLRDDGGTPAARRWYYGCGAARLALRDGAPVGLVYDDRGLLGDRPTIADLPDHDQLIAGMAGSWEFSPAP